MSFATITTLIEEVRSGRPVILVDDAARENEGDLILPAELATPEWINFMAHEGCGLICVSISQARAKALQLQPMTRRNSDPHGTAFTVSVDHASATTGISAYERAITVQALADPGTTADAFRQPGHIFPLLAHSEGVLGRAGHTEAAWELARLAGFSGTAVICEIMRDDGHMARLPDLQVFSSQHGLKLGSIADLVRYLSHDDSQLELVVRTQLPTKFGQFEITGFRDNLTGAEHVVLTMGDLHTQEHPVLVRFHSECLTGDVFHSLRCDCGAQRDAALAAIAKEGAGALIYLRQEGRGIGLLNKLKAYALQDNGVDTVEANERLGFPADARDFGIAAQMLRALGIKNVRLMTNNPRKLEVLERYGLTLAEHVPLQVGQNVHNTKYLKTKQLRLGHLLELSPRSVCETH